MALPCCLDEGLPAAILRSSLCSACNTTCGALLTKNQNSYEEQVHKIMRKSVHTHDSGATQNDVIRCQQKLHQHDQKLTHHHSAALWLVGA